MNAEAQQLQKKITDHTAVIGIIGLGYVGLPLALAFTEKGFRVIGFDTDPVKVDKINRGDCYIKHLDPTRLTRAVGLPTLMRRGGRGKSEFRNPKSEIDPGEAGREFKIQNSKLIIEASEYARLSATSDFSRLSEPDTILICVPTPLGTHKEPDLQYVEASAEAIRQSLRPGQLIILESTTYPGTTDDLLLPILESTQETPPPVISTEEAKRTSGETSAGTETNTHPPTPNRGHSDTRNKEAGRAEQFKTQNSKLKTLKCGEHFFLAFSPEREDPGNKDFGTTNVPKVVGGVDNISGDLAQLLYDQIIDSTIRVASARVAEASKLTENIFRSVNIALVNELKIIYDRLGIDIWEVLDAAETKPFGFMRFNPGPGLGGHCLIGSEWLRVRGSEIAGVYRAADLFDHFSRRDTAVVTRSGIFVEPAGA